ncbi:MAG: hypothetical protein ACFE88_06480 [Candidatus Hermodarchaeota archaeon]
MLCVCTLSVSLGIIISVFKPEELVFISIFFGALSLFIFLVYLNYRGIKITLTNYELELKYGIFNHKRILIKQITSCDITKTPFKTYGGVGIRLGLDGSWAYNADFGESVKLTFHRGSPFVFSTRNPQKICKLIQELSDRL